MDQETLSAYDAKAASFAQDWHDQPAPSDLHAVVKRYFRPGATADIGCGSGRDVASTEPSRTPRKKFVFDSIVVVPCAPSGKFMNAHAAPVLSASAITAPPCRRPPAVQTDSDHSRLARTSAAADFLNVAPMVRVNGMRSSNEARSGVSCAGGGGGGGGGVLMSGGYRARPGKTETGMTA